MFNDLIIVRTREEIDLVYQEALLSASEGNSAYPAETFEGGVAAVLAWLTDKNASHPLEWDDSLMPKRW